MNVPICRKLTILGAGLAVGLAALPARAETAALEEVIVTATKRAENLQQVPLSITALTSVDITRRSIRDLQDIAASTPGLTYFDANPVLELPVIRGISQTVITAPDRNVAMFFNGVFLSNNNASNFNMLDMERVEIVKGPVSALYGRNGFAGAINYVPKKADLTAGWNGELEATGGSQRRGGGKIALNIPLIDNTLAMRLTAGYDAWDGSIPNNFGGYTGGYAATELGWDIRWKPTDALSVGEFGFFVDDTRGESAQYAFANNCGVIGGTNPPRPSFYCGALQGIDNIAIPPIAYGAKRKGVLTGLNIDYDVGPFTASVIGGFVDLQTSYFEDLDFTPDTRGQLFYMYPTVNGPLNGNASVGTAYLHTYVGNGPDTTRDISWELRLASKQDQRLRWMLGASWYKHYLTRTAEIGIDSTGYTGPGVPYSVYERSYNAFKPVTGLSSLVLFNANHIDDQAPAAYLSLNYDVTKALTLNADYRYDRPHRKLTTDLGLLAVQTRIDGYSTMRFSADYKLDADKMVYVSAAKGVLDGFFNGVFDATASLPIPVALQNYKPSVNWTYELGGKASWLDHRLITNATLFYIKYTDLQISNAPPLPLRGTLIANAAGATSKGIELEVNARLTKQISAGLGYAYTDPTYDSGTQDLGNNRYCGASVPPLCTTDVSGNPLTRASKNTLNLWAQYDGTLNTDWSWYGRLDGRYQSKQYPRSIPLQWVSGYGIANARLGFSRHEKLDLEFWVKNLTDKLYIQTGIAQPLANPAPNQVLLPDFGPNSMMGERRSYGATARYKF